jgi:predicted nucleic acid-binding protein
LDEVERNLIKKFQIHHKNARRFTQRISQIADVYDPKGTVSIIEEDPTDNFVLETAWIGRAKYLVSGDRHILPLKIFRNIRIVDAATFYQIAKGI